jgi:hypothetical protein
MSEEPDWQVYVRKTTERHARRYLAFLEEHAAAAREDLVALEIEHDNLLIGMRVAHRAEEWEMLLDYAGIFCRPDSGYLGVRGHWSELQEMLLLALTAAQRRFEKSC